MRYGSIQYRLEFMRQWFFGDTAIGRRLSTLATRLFFRYPENKLVRWLFDFSLPF